MRLPPHFPEGERAILGGVLLDNEPLSEIATALTEDDFYREGHRLIWHAIQGLHARNEPVDWISLTDELKKAGKLETVGGPAFLAELADAVPSVANIQHYVERVREKGIRRRLISAACDMADAAYEEDSDLQELLDRAEQIVFAQNESLVQGGWHSMQSLAIDGFRTIEALYERKEAVTGVPTGFKDLDRITAGWQPSDLIIIAGRPSMGKTAFALDEALHAAMEAHVPTGIFSLEMSKEQLAMRTFCMTARVNMQALRTGYLSDRDWASLTLAAGSIAEAPLWIDDTAAITPMELRTKARRLKREHGLGLIIVDYLQLMRSNHRGESREREISEISGALKALAKELNVPVIALSQLNRKVEDRADKRPMLADLRESGAIEQDADVIIFIYRDEVYNKSLDNPKRGEAEIIVGKQRNGPVDTVRTAFRKEWSRFLPLSMRDEESAHMEAI